MRLRLASLAACSLTLTMVAVACGDDDPAVTPAGGADAGKDSAVTPGFDSGPSIDTDTGTPEPADSSVTDSAVTDGAVGDSGDAGTGLAPTQLAKFNAVFGELAEGVAVVTNGPVVGFAPLGKIVQVSPDGGTTVYATFAGASQSFTLGMATDSAGALYVAIASTGATPVPAPGVYKIPAGGGTPVAFAISTTKPMAFVNGLALKGTDLYITDSTGTIFKADSAGTTTEWLTDNVLAGDVNDCKLPNGFPIGANGIAFDATNIYVTNTDKATLHRIPIGADGKAGTPVLVVKDKALLCGADGLAIDTDGSFLIAVNAKNSIARVTAAGVVSVVSQGATLDGPGSVLITGTGASKRLLITNTAFGSSAVDAGGSNAGLLSLPLP